MYVLHGRKPDEGICPSDILDTLSVSFHSNIELKTNLIR